MNTRIDETWHRLRDWTNGQPSSERLASQILHHEGYTRIDPSHPLGGPDKGKDAIAFKDGNKWIMAAYFPRGQQTISSIKAKFANDAGGAKANRAYGIAFVTNQEVGLSLRSELSDIANGINVDIYHLERISSILDRPEMHPVRFQFLKIDYKPEAYNMTKPVNYNANHGSIINSYNQIGGQIAHKIVNNGEITRSLSDSAIFTIARELSKYPPEFYRIDHITGNYENERLAGQIIKVLNLAGWKMFAQGTNQTFPIDTGLHIYFFERRYGPALLRYMLMQAGLAPSGWTNEFANRYFGRFRGMDNKNDHVGILIGSNVNIERCPKCGNMATFETGTCNQCGK